MKKYNEDFCCTSELPDDLEILNYQLNKSKKDLIKLLLMYLVGTILGYIGENGFTLDPSFIPLDIIWYCCFGFCGIFPLIWLIKQIIKRKLKVSFKGVIALSIILALAELLDRTTFMNNLLAIEVPGKIQNMGFLLICIIIIIVPILFLTVKYFIKKSEVSAAKISD